MLKACILLPIGGSLLRLPCLNYNDTVLAIRSSAHGRYRDMRVPAQSCCVSNQYIMVRVIYGSILPAHGVLTPLRGTRPCVLADSSAVSVLSTAIRQASVRKWLWAYTFRLSFQGNPVIRQSAPFWEPPSIGWGKASSRSPAYRTQPTGSVSCRGSRKRFFAPAKKGAPTPWSSSGGVAPPLTLKRSGNLFSVRRPVETKELPVRAGLSSSGKRVARPLGVPTGTDMVRGAVSGEDAVVQTARQRVALATEELSCRSVSMV